MTFKSLNDCYELRNGMKIPCVGYGTWLARDGQSAVDATIAAIQNGYRHIDTAQMYENEGSIGEALAKCGVVREELFITTKLHNNIRGYDETIAAFEESRRLLGLEYVDMFLIHWPNPVRYREDWAGYNAASWRAMETLQKEGKIRALGLSNFKPHHIETLMQTATVAPVVNQIRLCPGVTQPETVEYCTKNNILMEAYSPMGHGNIFKSDVMLGLAEKYDRSVAQLCIRWSLQNGWLPLPKSVTPSRIIENASVFDFEIDPEDMTYIAGLTDSCGFWHDDPDVTNF